jgi:hypothetical protein
MRRYKLSNTAPPLVLIGEVMEDEEPFRGLDVDVVDWHCFGRRSTGAWMRHRADTSWTQAEKSETTNPSHRRL